MAAVAVVSAPPSHLLDVVAATVAAVEQIEAHERAPTPSVVGAPQTAVVESAAIAPTLGLAAVTLQRDVWYGMVWCISVFFYYLEHLPYAEFESCFKS